MRRKVPFQGEDTIARGSGGSTQAKKVHDQVINDLLSTQQQPTTWDDFVASDYPDPAGASLTLSRPHMPVVKPARKNVPVPPGAILKDAVQKSNFSKVTRSTIDWLPINGGHGLKINICGNLDQNLRSEWRRLIEESGINGIGQFEFNLTESPNLTLTGLGMLLLFKEQKGSNRNDIKLCHCNKDVWQMLQWAGMDKYFTIQGKPDL